MKQILPLTGCIILLMSLSLQSIAQDLPHHMTEEEKLAWPQWYNDALLDTRVVSPPPGPLRTPGEWEEQQAICITWTSYTSVLREIVKWAQLECKVIIHCTDSNTVKSYLTSGGVPLTSNLKYIETAFNSVWIRDYGAQSVYQNDVGTLYLVDWKYNRPTRTDDDVLPGEYASLLGIPFYEMDANPYLLVATGGNLMWDGMGTVMSSELILDENTALTEAQINTLTTQYWGTSRYIKFNNLPYDGIHHIDMHMKLLDEETILVGEYPTGIADGPQIEANLQYLLTNFNSAFGTPYKVIRIPMPPNLAGTSWPPSSYYRTYTNGVFVNKTYIYPTYYEKYDTTAARIMREALPGYTIIGIDCDPDPISASGAIHCITSNVCVTNPLLIIHKRLEDTNNDSTPYQVDARIQHSTGIASAQVYYRTDTLQPYVSVPMTLTSVPNNTWTGYIPAQTGGTTVYYYVHAQATGGKTQNRPITAPDGYWEFDVLVSAGQEFYTANPSTLQDIYPNPARSITCVPVVSDGGDNCRIDLYDVTGRVITHIFDGTLQPGTNHFFFDAMGMQSGVYSIRLTTDEGIQTKKVIVYGY